MPWVLIMMGGFGIVATRSVHLLLYPELTEAEALWAMGDLYIGGMIIITCGLFLLSIENR